MAEELSGIDEERDLLVRCIEDAHEGPGLQKVPELVTLGRVLSLEMVTTT